MRAKVTVTLKHGVLDPQGKAIEHALGHLGFNDVDAVRQGKYLELDLSTDDEAKAKEEVNAICEKLLANTVIENFQFTLEKRKTK